VSDFIIHMTYLAVDDPEKALAFYRDALGFEVRNDVGYGTMRWITAGPAGQPAPTPASPMTSAGRSLR
jgi:catechol 2,3-dioxygenase-like lactoylglutathione lyase family enzyme